MAIQFPILLAGIDPVQEAKLMNLPATMVGGHYLREGTELSAPEAVGSGGPFSIQRVPVIAADTTFVDDTLTGSVTRLDAGPGQAAATLLADKRASDLLAGLPGTRVGSVHLASQGAYGTLLKSFNANDLSSAYFYAGISGFWSIGPARYRLIGNRHVAVTSTTNPASVWNRSGTPAPPGSDDTAFHRLVLHSGKSTDLSESAGIGAGVMNDVGLTLVGRYDPNELPGFSPLNRVPLQTYYPPTVTGATAQARALLGNEPLGPDMNVAGYLSQPPLLLTTLTAATQIESDHRYSGLSPAAPISSIRVRVAGVTGLNAQSRARVDTVAESIAKATGLQVQVTAGSSPTAVTVDLPAGRYGRPALDVRQDWVQEGAVAHLVSSIDAESLGMFVLVLVAAALLLTNGITASVRARRTDLGVLAALGWSPRDLRRSVLTEVLTVAGSAGALGVGVAALLVWVLGLHLALVDAVLVLPVAMVVAVVAGWWPAGAAARADLTLTLAPAVRRGRRSRPARRPGRLAWTFVIARPGRAVVGAAGLALGVAAVTVLLAVELRFQGQVSRTLIGHAGILRAQPAELAAAALVAVLGAASVADVVAFDLAERAEEWAALAALGWRPSQLARLAAGHGALLGTVGSAVGAVAGFAVGAVLTPGVDVVALTALIGLACGVLLSCAAVVVPVLRLIGREPARVLAEG